MKTKILLWSVASILIIGIAAGAFWWLRRPQVITFSDDAKVTLLAVEYGKHHVPPVVKMVAPAAAGNRPARARRGGGTFTTTNDTLVLWFRQQYDATGNQYHGFQYYIYDKGNTACVQGNAYHSGNGRQGDEIMGIEMNAFPRRQGKFLVAVEENGNGGQELAEKKFAISNPVRSVPAKLAASDLPATQTDDDLAVTLSKLVAGANSTYTRSDADPDDPVNKAVQATFHVERNGKPVSNWQPVAVDTFDGSGNRVSGWGPGLGNNGPQGDWLNGDGTLTYQYGLWLDEPWKIRVEFSQQSDFAPEELWNVPNVPVFPGRQQEMYNYGGNRRQALTNSPVAEVDLNGYHLKVLPAKDFTDAGANNWMQGGVFVQVSPDLSPGFRLTLKVTDNQSNDVTSSFYANNVNNNVATYRFRLQDSSGLTNLNLTLALHKSRFVEFTAKPEKAPADAAQQ